MSSSGWTKGQNCVWRRPGAQVVATQTKSGKLMIIQSGNRRTKASWEAWQKALNILHLEKLCLLTSYASRQNIRKCVIHGKMLNYNIDFTTNYAGKNPNGFHTQGESLFHSKHEQTGITYRENNESGKTMNKESPLICQQVCQEENAFRSRSYLVVHWQTHVEEKTCECSECGKDFSSKEYLIVHHKTHTGEKLHECSEHGKAFSFSSQQVIHHKPSYRQRSP